MCLVLIYKLLQIGETFELIWICIVKLTLISKLNLARSQIAQKCWFQIEIYFQIFVGFTYWMTENIHSYIYC